MRRMTDYRALDNGVTKSGSRVTIRRTRLPPCCFRRCASKPWALAERDGVEHIHPDRKVMAICGDGGYDEQPEM
jgi:hypothetical protein